MPRLFTGIEVPMAQRTQLSFLQSGISNVRWIEPSDFHITLRFIGDVPPSTANAIVEALGGQSWAAPFIELGELGTFGSTKPKLVYASVKEDEKLRRLASKQERLMQQLGLEPEHRHYTPHVTLARFRGGTDVQQIARYLGQHGGFKTAPFQPTRFVLYSARESTGGGPYKIEQSWTFDTKMR